MKRLIVPAVFLLALLPAWGASACPNCKDTVAESGRAVIGNVAGGFNYSIFFMLGGITAVGGLVIRMIVKETRS